MRFERIIYGFGQCFLAKPSALVFPDSLGLLLVSVLALRYSNSRQYSVCPKATLRHVSLWMTRSVEIGSHRRYDPQVVPPAHQESHPSTRSRNSPQAIPWALARPDRELVPYLKASRQLRLLYLHAASLVQLFKMARSRSCRLRTSGARSGSPPAISTNTNNPIPATPTYSKHTYIQ